MTEQQTPAVDPAEFEALRTENAALKAAADETARLNAIRGKGLPDTAADMIPTGADPAEWVQKFGEFLAIPAAELTPDHSAEQGAQARAGALEANAQPPATDLEARMDQAIAQGPDAFRGFLREQRATGGLILR